MGTTLTQMQTQKQPQPQLLHSVTNVYSILTDAVLETKDIESGDTDGRDFSFVGDDDSSIVVKAL